jgi:CheY-like chemotaxis protein
MIVEDEGVIALMIEDMLADMGCTIVCSAASVSQALKCVEAGGFDFALLDVNLGEGSGVTVADALAPRGIPYAFASGYGQAGVPERLHSVPIIRKPFTGAQLEQFLRQGLLSAR